MKKLLLVFITIMFALPSHAYVLDTRKVGGTERLVLEIGYKLLNANKIPYRITFFAVGKGSPNACSYYRTGRIVINDSMIIYADDENEIASVLAHEIAHSVDFRQGIFKGYFSKVPMLLASKKYEYKADKRAIDYMVKAGYNPLASITILNKVAPDSRYDFYSTHPLTSKRIMAVYEYIYTKYPEYLVQNEYKNSQAYQNFLLTSKENRQKFEEKIKSGSKKQVNYL